MAFMVPVNTVYTQKKQSLRKSLQLVFPKNPEAADEMMDAFELAVEEMQGHVTALVEDHRIQNKFEIRDELSKELATKGELFLVKTELQSAVDQLRTELRAEIAELRAEVKSEIADLRAEVKSEIAELRAEVKSEIAELRTELKSEIAELRAEIKLSNLKSLFQTLFIVAMVLLTTDGGQELLKTLLPFLR